MKERSGTSLGGHLVIREKVTLGFSCNNMAAASLKRAWLSEPLLIAPVTSDHHYWFPRFDRTPLFSHVKRTGEAEKVESLSLEQHSGLNIVPKSRTTVPKYPTFGDPWLPEAPGRASP